MKKLLSFLLLLILIFLSFSSIFIIFFLTGYEIHRDVSYGEDPCEITDIYIPKKAYRRKENGVVLFIHGGSWSGGDKSEEELRSRNVANQGYIAASINYTLYSDENDDIYNVEIVLNEINLALERVKNYTSELGVTVNKAATAGYSAGAHLSMLYSYSRGDSAPIDIKFTANMAGPADICPDIWGEDLSIIIGERLSGKDITLDSLRDGEADAILSEISPVSYVNSNTPPSLLMYGGADTTVSHLNGESLKLKFDEYGIEYDYVFLPDANHALIANPRARLSYPKKLIEYCKNYFGY